MKKILILLICVLCIRVQADTIIDGGYFLNKSIVWNKRGSPYIIRGQVTLSSSTLTITDADIIFEQGNINSQKSQISVNNSNISGTSQSFLFSVFNSSTLNAGSVTLGIDHFVEGYSSSVRVDNATSYTYGNGMLFSLYSGSSFSLSDSHIENYQGKIFKFWNTATVDIHNSEFVNNNTVVDLAYSVFAHINKNDFENNNIAIQSSMYDSPKSEVDFEDNYFSNEYPKIHLFEDPNAYETNLLIGPIKIDIFSKQKHVNKIACCSNILFLPGLMGSRLYMIDKTQNQLWEPNRNADVKKLFLDQFGQSINNIFTKDVISKTNIVGGASPVDKTIYKNFVEYLDQLVQSKIIQSYNAMPYDWRYSADDILLNGIYFKDTHADLIKTLQDLQKSSKTGKVAIVTHSNGGLIAKQLILELQKQHLEGIIDNIIFVAMPEFGTPQAITALLYGHSQSLGYGLILKSSVAKELAKNMPSAYSLLPSEAYYTNKGVSHIVQETIIDAYDGLNRTLWNKSKELHAAIDNLIFPKNINIYQIVCTGIPTVSDVVFKPNDTSRVVPVYDLKGDGVVQDLFGLRNGTSTYFDLSKSGYVHANIMNSPDVITRIDDIVRRKKLDSFGLDYDKIIKNNNYKLLRITNEKNSLSKYVQPFDMDMSFGYTRLADNTDNELYFDKFSLNTVYDFDKITESLKSSNRFEEYDNEINYFHMDNLSSITVDSKSNNTFNIGFIGQVDTGLSGIDYKDIPVFKDSEVILHTDDNFQTLQLQLPLTGKSIQLESEQKKTQKTVDEKADEAISMMKSSNMDPYLKDTYIRRIGIFKNSKDRHYLDSLKNKAVEAINSINKYNYSAVLRGRYAKLKEDYIYLSVLLLKL